ncbi:MAG: Holliday junction branch migration protein RuvA [Nannocystaceae bacterium]
MIGWLQGQVILRDPRAANVIVGAGGVGYEVRVSLQTMASIPEVGGTVALWIYTHVREDIFALYGFASPAEKDLFLRLLGVPKVGPKNAMAVLGGMPHAELLACLAGGDAGRLEKIPGIGKKTAEQILLSLKGKVLALDPGGGASTPASQPAEAALSLEEEAQMVLVGLGWRAREVDGAIASVVKSAAWKKASEGKTLDELVRRALAELMAR